jgi:hypothetical protein
MELNLPTSREILKLVAHIDRFRGAWSMEASLPPDRLARLREVAKVHSVASSCRLIGIRIADTEAAALLRGESPPFREGAAILGYANALDATFPRDGALVTPAEIARLNAIVEGASPDLAERSPWRHEPIHLEAFDAEGHALGRVFQTLPPRLIEDKLDTACTWLEIELRSGEHHPLLVIAAFYLVFVNISPFTGGNTRTARALSSHLLRRAGYAYVPYGSLERAMEESREAYYDGLDASSTRLWTGEADLEPWTRSFLQMLKTHADRIAAKLDLERRSLDLPPLQRQILETVRDHGTARAGLLLASTGTNRNTLKDNLRRMVDRGLIERVGRSKGAFYRIATGESTAN